MEEEDRETVGKEMRWGDKKESDRKKSVWERKKEKESKSRWDRVRKREQEDRNYHKQNIQQQPQQSSVIIKKACLAIRESLSMCHM